MRNRSPRSAARVVLAVLLLTLSELALAAAGKVLFVSGPVTLERGASRTLNKGDALEVGDVIVTGEKARAQILMADGAKIALRAGSRFRIDEFALPQAVNAPNQAAVVSTDGRSVSSLLKGGFRTTTGSVGKVDRNAYEVRTPIGTLGIRGTDYAAVFCVGDCTDVPGMAAGAPIRDGLYLGVYEGSIAFTGGGQVLQLNQGDFVFIPLAGTRPEPLQAPPAFLEEDGAGRITLGSAGTARPAASSVQLDEFNQRRSPTGTVEGDKEDGRKAEGDVSQPVIGTTPNGTPVDLTGGDAPRPRGQISYNLGAPGPVSGFTAVSTSDADTFVRDANANVAAFSGLFPGAAGAVPATYQIGTSANTNTGSHAATGLTWGRWNTGAPTIVAGGTTLNPSLALQSLHWIAGTPFDLDPVLPVSGTRSYVLVGATSPTDTRGNVGVLGAVSLDANFTQQTVSAALTFDLDGRTWFASGSGGFSAASDNTVSGSFTRVEVSGLLLGNGTLSGFFSEPASGGATVSGFGLSYLLTDSTLQLGTASGVIAFQQGTGQPVAPPALQNRDVAFAILQLPQVGGGTSGTLTNPPTVAYTVDTSFNLTQLAGILPTDPIDVATYNIGTATLAEGGVNAATVLRWGRWSGGDITVTGLVSGQTFTQSLAQQSLHWIETGNLAAPPVMPTSGTATYTLVGATSPTDALGNVGVLGSATFSADFTAQTVDSALDLTLNNLNWVVSGRGSIGAQANLQPHQFVGAYTGTINGALPAMGSYTGFFSLPGSTVPGVPGGAGLTYVLTDGQGVFSATGVAVFRGP
jgi:hypothetical protein